MPGIVGAEARHAQWMPSGDEIVFAAGARILAHHVDTGRSRTLWERADTGVVLELALPIRGGDALLAVAIEDGRAVGVAVVDLVDGSLEVIRVPIAAVGPTDYGVFDRSALDCDADGRGNGIDPSPGC